MTTEVIKWRLNELLASQRKTSRDLATALGVHENSVYRLRKQDRMPRLEHDTLEGICKFLECTPGDLLVMVADEEAEGDRHAH